jgi:hypothetical protein
LRHLFSVGIFSAEPNIPVDGEDSPLAGVNLDVGGHGEIIAAGSANVFAASQLRGIVGFAPCA